jgi:hypothetical protein
MGQRNTRSTSFTNIILLLPRSLLPLSLHLCLVPFKFRTELSRYKPCKHHLATTQIPLKLMRSMSDFTTRVITNQVLT